MLVFSIDPKLYEFCTERQAEILRAIDETGSTVGAAAKLGCHKTLPSATHKAVLRKAAKQGYSPAHDMTRTVPEGFRLKGTSTYYDSEGKVRGQWVKTSAEDESHNAAMLAFQEFVEGLCEGIKGMSPYVPPPALSRPELLAVYPIGDHHYGMKADARETGADYDCKIAADLLAGSVGYLSSTAAYAENALLLNLGDFYHANDSKNETPTGGNRVDVDTRHGQVVESGALALVRAVLRLLEVHKTVRVWNMRGNHDPDAAFALSIAMQFYFHNEPRVIVDMSPSLYKYHRHGVNLIGSHHGHGAKASDLPLIMAVDRPEDWAVTTERVWHCGHIHHKTVKEHPGVDVESHRTLAGSDAWHRGKGYRSKRDMAVIIYHEHLGEVQRNRFNPKMMEAA